MRILILGATGMLGHRLWIELSKHHEVWGTTQGALPSFTDYEHMICGFDISEYDNMSRAEFAYADVIINCIAAIPQRAYPPAAMILANAWFPHDISSYCEERNKRLIHFSTDGVFSGKRGNYTEDDTPDATDVYGMTKRLGEISDQKHVLTLRCCPIGREIGAKKSLVEWFLAQTQMVRGYAKSYFNGLTTHEIARILNEEVLPNADLHGLYHVSSERISKHHFLNLLKMYYNRDIEIDADPREVIDRTLDSTRFRQMTEYVPDSWERMLQVMAADNALYEGVTA